MAKRVEKWMTFDGKFFDTLEEAEEHELFCEIQNMLGDAMPDCAITTGAVSAVVAWVKQDRENLREFLSED